MKRQYKRVMTIAGSDPSGGAGIQADIKTISANRCYATSAITAVVNENTIGVYGVHALPAEFVVGQIESILNDIGTDAVKIGMLHSAELIEAVALTLTKFNAPNIVFDPVMVATSGDSLVSGDVVDAMTKKLLPISRIITPNIPEAETLLSRKITTVDEMKDSCIALAEMGTSVLLKGGHLTDNQSLTDILCDAETHTMLEFPSPRIDTVNTHGTGCTLSSAIASQLAHGKSLTAAVATAKDYMNNAIAIGAEYSIGHGHGPVCHFFNLWKS